MLAQSSESTGTLLGILLSLVCAEADGEILFELGEVLGSVVEELGLTTGFQPEVGDACFAHSVDDDSWYRGVVRNRNPDGTFTVRMIDFGNEVSAHWT